MADETEPRAQRERTMRAEQISDFKSSIREGITDLKTVTREGFDSLKSELKLSREQGHIPITVMEKILASNNAAYSSMMKSSHEAFAESRRSSNESNRRILNQLCWMMGCLVAWVTGVQVYSTERKVDLVKKEPITQTAPVQPEVPQHKPELQGAVN